MSFVFRSQNQGGALIFLIVITALFSVLMLPLLDNVVLRFNFLRIVIDREQALQIAEAGINYYQWRLVHFPGDYQDGTGQPGPYVHDFIDTDTQQITGQFSLNIIPPPVGSTVVTIQSTGWTVRSPTAKRTITVQFGVPSLAKYSFLSNTPIWIGDKESVTGQFMSNNGIRFDGTGNAAIQSTKSAYDPEIPGSGYYCPSWQGSPCPAWKDGIWCNPDPPAHPEVKNFWQFPVPNVDYSSLTSDLATMKTSAEEAGIYLPPSNKQGYSLVFDNDGTVTIYRVDTLRSNPKGYDLSCSCWNYRYTDYNNRTVLSGYNRYPLPVNGIIYAEDNVWVEGTVRGRVTVAAAILPYSFSTAPSIYIPRNIVYSAKDGSNSLGLIAQRSVVVTYYAADNLEINAAMIAQNGSAQFFYWKNNIKNSITVYGSIMTNTPWTWTWVNSSGTVVSGYRYTYSNYDPDLLYAPPPSFPLSTSGYQQLNWRSD